MPQLRPREAPAAPAEPGAGIALERVRQAEEEQDERDRPDRCEQGLFDGHAAHRITPTRAFTIIWRASAV
jgi:hypothetical protein